jgi:hypothetical protein
VVFRDLVIQGGLAQDNGSNGALAGSTDALGGGILNNGGNVTLNNVVVQNNVARAGYRPYDPYDGYNALGGGTYSTSGTLTIMGAVITNNQAVGGNAVFVGGHGGSGSGGGLYTTSGALTITGATITNNQATGGRGGGTTDSNVRGGDGGSGAGGGLYATGGSLDIAHTSIAGNRATGGPAGTGTGWSGAGRGGTGQGGGLYVSGSSLSISTSTIASNQGIGGPRHFPLYGGGDDGAGQGGGLYNGGTLAVSNCTVSGNSSTNGGVHGTALGGGGGGIYNNGTLTVSNSSLSGNSAVVLNGYGAEGGGGLFVHVGLPVLHNTLIAGNFRGATGTTRDDVYGALNSGGDYNLIGDGTGMTGLQSGVNGNLVGSAAAPIDPLLGPLQDNGGPTKTHALLAGSPALNVGNPSQLGVADQRGVVRSGGVNIGAYQASASAFVVTAPATVTAGAPFDLTVTAVDPFGQTAVGYTGTVTFTSADPYGATLPADYPFTAADHGARAFPGGAALYTAGTWDITATDIANSSITASASVTVNPAAADHLLFLQPPTDTAAGQTITPAVTVAIVDPFGNVVTSDSSDTVTLAIGNNPTGGTLSGTLTVTVSGGIATFSDLAIDLAGDGYTLHATTAGLTNADSAAFRITA